MAYILKIVMLATHTHALLAGCRALIGTNIVSQKDILKLIHSCVCKQERRVIKGNQRCTGNNLMARLLEIFQEGLADLIAACQFNLLFQMAAVLLQGIIFSARPECSHHRSRAGADAQSAPECLSGPSAVPLLRNAFEHIPK